MSFLTPQEQETQENEEYIREERNTKTTSELLSGDLSLFLNIS